MSELKLDAKKASKWGLLSWLVKDGSSPLIAVFSRGSADIVDYHNRVVFRAYKSEENYLCINDDTLKEALSSVDKSTKENLERLENVGKLLLKKPVSRVNVRTGLSGPIKNAGTNEDAPKRFAKLLSDEKKFRELRSPHNLNGA